MLTRRTTVGWLTLAAALITISEVAQASGSRTGSVTQNATAVDRFGKFELNLQLQGQWKNPFDPNEANVAVEFTSPSNRKLRVPAFYTQDYSRSIHTPQDDRRSIGFVKFYTEERGWHAASDIEFFFDDFVLTNSKTGQRKVLDDMESGDVRRWGSDGVSWSTELVHGGKQSLRFAPHITDIEHWPGIVTDMKGVDWSAYDGMDVWIYPRYKGTPGSFSLYFTDRKSGNSPIQTMSVGQKGLLPNRWNHIVWSWRDFPRSLQFQKKGVPHWKARFAPTEVGKYRFRVVANNHVESSGAFTCRSSTNPGFVRVSPTDKRYFIRDDGKPFFPIGHDVAWDLKWALQAFPKMAAHGENGTYCIMIPWETCIEWGELGRYDLERAAKVDALIELAAANGIYLKLSFDVHDALRRNASWETNPYSSLRGGPCNGPNDFYTDPKARELYKRRLRYMLARWGYCPNVMAWETVAEIDGATELPDGTAGWGYPTKPTGSVVTQMLVKWLREMHSYMRAEDPYGRLLTVCFGGDVSDQTIWQMPEVQYVQLHHYDSLDPGSTIPVWCRRLTHFGKPFLITESGWWADWTKPINDPQGLSQHDGIWASALGGASGSSYSWWWEQIDALNLYPHYLALRRFVNDVNWPNERFRSVQASCTLPKPTRAGPVAIVPKAPFDGGPTTRFTVRRNGEFGDPGQVPQFLLAPERRKGSGPVFVVDCPVPGEFKVHVDSVSPDARLEISIDREKAMTHELPVQDVPGKVSKFDEKWKIWNCRYDEDFTVAVAAGHHEILVENTKPGGSWILVTSYTLTHYVPPKLNVVGLTGRGTTILWIQNTESTWWNAQQGLTPGTISGASVMVEGLRPGRYSIEWWDTYKGTVTKQSQALAIGGKLKLTLPPIRRDVACKLRKLE